MRWTFSLLFLLLGLSVVSPAGAQTQPSWEQLFHELMTVEDGESADWEETFELLSELAAHPMDVNTVSREQLEMLPFLTSQHVEELMEYRHRYGGMKSLGELYMITSLDYRRQQLLRYFLTVGEQQERALPRFSDVVNYGRHELMASARLPMNRRQGDRNGYLGYPYRHWLRYQLTYGDYVKLGVLGAQDAGEPFLANRNSMGYDFYSFYLQVRHLGRIESAVVGRYNLSVGMGLVMNNSFGLGKLSTLQNLGRSATTLRAHSSRSSYNYLQGAAATVRLARGLTATAFASYRSLDATLASDGTATTLVKTGYHRTPAEMAKKNNTHSTDLGANVAWRSGGFHAGATMVYTHLDRQLKPNTATLYRRHYPAGCDFLNLSADYSYVSRRLTLSGETAINRQGALATLNSVSLLLGNGLSLMALQRFFSYRYTALYARSFSDGGRVQNESGIYVGLNWQPSPQLQLQAFTDYAYYGWARYLASQSSHAWDHLVLAVYTPGRWTLQARYRLHTRQRDNDDKTALVSRREHRARLSVGYAAGRLSTVTQADWALTDFRQRDRGWALGQQLVWRPSWLQLSGNVIYFHTDSYESRLYTYERGPLYNFSFPMLYGHGLRYSLMARADLSSSLMLTAKLGITDYFDRSTTGTGLQTVDGSSLTDVDLQVRWKF